MKGGVAAAAIVGVLAIAGLPTAVFVVAHNEYGDSSSSAKPHDRREHHGKGGLKLRGPKHGLPGAPGLRPLPGHPLLPGDPILPRDPMLPGPRGQVLKDLRELSKWVRCVVDETDKHEGAFDPEKVCGKKPEVSRRR